MIHLSTLNPLILEDEPPTRPAAAWIQLLIVIIAPSLGALSGLWIWPGPVGGTLYALCKVLLYGIPLVILFRRLGLLGIASWPFQGWTARGSAAGLVSGLVIGLFILALWWFVLSGRVNVTALLDAVKKNGMTERLRFLIFATWLCVINSLLEEIVFRWYVDSRLQRIGVPFLYALPLSALIFTIHHVIVLSAFFDWPLVLMGSLGVFTGGVLWSLLLRRYKALSPGWISHALVDVAIMVIGWWILTPIDGGPV